jgi:hypothetical protein
VHGKQFAAWEAECLDRLVSLGNTRLALLVVDKRAEAPRVRPGPVRRVRSLLRSERILWFLYERLLVNGRVKALEPVDWSARLQGVAVLECDVSRRGRCSEYFSVSDIDIMRGHDLDFILRFAFGIVRGEILQVPRYGIWSFHHDDEMRYRGGPAAFWEIYRGDPQTGACCSVSPRGSMVGDFAKARFRHGATFVHEKPRCRLVWLRRLARGGLSRSAGGKGRVHRRHTLAFDRTDLSRPEQSRNAALRSYARPKLCAALRPEASVDLPSRVGGS